MQEVRDDGQVKVIIEGHLDVCQVLERLRAIPPGVVIVVIVPGINVPPSVVAELREPAVEFGASTGAERGQHFHPAAPTTVAVGASTTALFLLSC